MMDRTMKNVALVWTQTERTSGQVGIKYLRSENWICRLFHLDLALVPDRGSQVRTDMEEG